MLICMIYSLTQTLFIALVGPYTTYCSCGAWALLSLNYVYLTIPQNTLLSLFPREAGKYDHLDRCIPYLPTADNVLQLLGGNFSAKHLEARLATINHYCETILVKLGPHLSQSHYVLQFFKCQPGDKQLLG